MEHIKTLNTKNLQNTVKKGGCGECQTSCQSACKTSCTVGNQSCEHKYDRVSGRHLSSGVKAAASFFVMHLKEMLMQGPCVFQR